ncbi:MAG: hypothetical protein V3V29_05450 [Acidimicrobiia bacterium]
MEYGTELFDELRAMELPPGDFAVFGSGPLLVRGIIQVVNDFDVVCRGAAWERARELGRLVDIDHDGVQIVSTHGGAITFGITWGYGELDISDLIDTAETIAGLPFALLKHVVAYKQIAGRPKDLEHLRLLEQYAGGGPA